MPAFSPSFLDALRDKIALSDLVGRKVKLTKKGREFSGLCPFHTEKTPSFTINDDKGFYHCFGCGAHGDIITFMMEAHKMPFVEAVEYLAGLAGMPLPKESPEQQEKADQRKKLGAIMETACQFFQQQLFGQIGTEARNYLIGRSIGAEVAKQFRLGYAPTGSALTAHLAAKGASLPDCIALGLSVRNDKGNVHDYFYNRVMFPILDRRRHVIGFGARILGKGEPKYLNSPETPLFHKGENLYALPLAIDNMRIQNKAVLVEGYMDVIALHAAGFTTAVAPLGTALTEQQIKLLWQACDEPLICFDGDNAGRKAGERAMARALPILTPGKSLKFVSLPDGLDPDDMIRKRSPEAFAKCLDESYPLIAVFWESLIGGRALDAPEKMAKLEQDAFKIIAAIGDKTVRSYYEQEIRSKMFELARAIKGKKIRAVAKRHVLRTPASDIHRARMMVAYCLVYPQAAAQFLEKLGDFVFPEQELNDLFQKMAALIWDNQNITSEELAARFAPDDLRSVQAECEMLKRFHKADADIAQEMNQAVKESKILAIKHEKSLETDWDKIKELNKEIENLLKS
ncbi:MAG: DNA primase [Alphaproteobacteria bacterium]|nr:DNA primase [Alphaproteobacteria bacterium]